MKKQNIIHSALVFDLLGVLFRLHCISSFFKIGALSCNLPLKKTDNIFEPIEEGLALLKHCAQKNNLQLFILSNIGTNAFHALEKSFPSIIKMFDGAITSGSSGYKKPDVRIFQHLLTTHNLVAQECIFIDDSSTNISAAQELGFTSIVCHDFDEVKKTLTSLGI